MPAAGRRGENEKLSCRCLFTLCQCLFISCRCPHRAHTFPTMFKNPRRDAGARMKNSRAGVWFISCRCPHRAHMLPTVSGTWSGDHVRTRFITMTSTPYLCSHPWPTLLPYHYFKHSFPTTYRSFKHGLPTMVKCPRRDAGARMKNSRAGVLTVHISSDQGRYVVRRPRTNVFYPRGKHTLLIQAPFACTIALQFVQS